MEFAAIDLIYKKFIQDNYGKFAPFRFDMKKLIIIFLLAVYISGAGQPSADAIATIGQPFPAWQPGYLDLHHINTGRGNSAFYVLPDGTTILFDAGELDPTNP